MIVPVTVIASVLFVALLVSFEPVCANASDVSSTQQVRIASGVFMCTSQLMLECIDDGFPFTKGFWGICCTKFRFFAWLDFLLRF